MSALDQATAIIDRLQAPPEVRNAIEAEVLAVADGKRIEPDWHAASAIVFAGPITVWMAADPVMDALDALAPRIYAEGLRARKEVPTC